MVIFLVIENSALLGKECIIALKQIFTHKSLLHQIMVIFKRGTKGKMRKSFKGYLKLSKRDKHSSLPFQDII